MTDVKNLSDYDAVEKAYCNVPSDDAAEALSECLMDDKVTTYGMYESIETLYEEASEEDRELIEKTVAILTGKRFSTIARELLVRYLPDEYTI